MPWSPEDPTRLAPPIAEEVEQALLGALLQGPKAFDAVADILRAEHFGLPVHGRIYQAVCDLSAKGERPGPVTLRPYFETDPALAEVGAGAYLARMAVSSFSSINAAGYAEIIVDHWQRRELMTAFCEASDKLPDVHMGASAADIARDVAAIMDATTENRRAGSGPVDSGTSAGNALADADEAFKNKRIIGGVPTGISDLDKIVGCLERGQLVIVAGRPSMGKTALASGIVGYASKHFRREAERDATPLKQVLEFELEMSSTQMARRRLSAITGIPIQNIKNGWLNQSDFLRLMDAKERLAKLPILTDDTSGIGVDEILTRARRVARGGRLGFIMVDHIGLIRPSKEHRGNRTAEITAITGSLKEIAKQLNVPVVALSQLSREVEKREDKRPTLADLRDSGSIEQDADVVMFVYREEYYLSRSEPVRGVSEKDEAFQKRTNDWVDACGRAKGLAEIIVAKQRDGDTGSAKCRFDGPRALFSNLDQGEAGIE